MNCQNAQGNFHHAVEDGGADYKRRPGFRMENRLLLDKIDFEKGPTWMWADEYPMNDMISRRLTRKTPIS